MRDLIDRNENDDDDAHNSYVTKKLVVRSRCIAPDPTPRLVGSVTIHESDRLDTAVQTNPKRVVDSGNGEQIALPTKGNNRHPNQGDAVRLLFATSTRQEDAATGCEENDEAPSLLRTPDVVAPPNSHRFIARMAVVLDDDDEEDGVASNVATLRSCSEDLVIGHHDGGQSQLRHVGASPSVAPSPLLLVSSPPARATLSALQDSIASMEARVANGSTPNAAGGRRGDIDTLTPTVRRATEVSQSVASKRGVSSDAIAVAMGVPTSTNMSLVRSPSVGTYIVGSGKK